jgi:CDP-diacylglycerol--serine O-phosphatidyltransferase
MCDLISFGVLPALIVYMMFDKTFIVGVFATIYVLCALIRLSYFNVLEYERQEKSTQQRKKYLGVPVTTVAILFPMIYLISYKAPFIAKGIYLAFLLFLSGGFVSNIEIKKPERLGKILMVIVGIIECIFLLIIAGVDLV